MGLALIVAACGGGDHLVDPQPPPVIESAVIRVNPNNVLTAVVTAHVRNADSVWVSYDLAGDRAGNDSVTPAIIPVSADLRLPVLGLLPERSYIMRVIAHGAGGAVSSDSLSITTGALPPDLPMFRATGSDPSPGFVVFATAKHGVVIDNSGRIVWYHPFPAGAGLNFSAQHGRFYARPTATEPAGAKPLVEIDVEGNTLRRLGCARGLNTRPHDLIVEKNGTVWLLCDETRTMDLSAIGGRADAQVTGTNVQRISASEQLVFEWSVFDHFLLTDVDAATRSGAAVNWTHGNALELDADGNLLVSFRNLNELTKVNIASGAVMWRMGGLRNEFTFVGTPAPPFTHQHSVRLSGASVLTVLDNLGDPYESRAEAYTVDPVKRTAHLAQSYSAGVSTTIGGSVQVLPGGRTLASFGTAGRVEEFDATGAVTWRIDGNPGYVFRAQRIASLYAPGVGSAR